MKLKKIFTISFLSMCLLFISISLVPPLQAATHSLSKWDAGKFDLVVSLGWLPTTDDKTKLKTVFELFAQDVWTMTEGKHSIRRLYVYPPNPVTNKARDWKKADVRFLNTADAANATIAGFKKAGRIFVDDDLSDLSEAGHALAHELGHYAYAVYDEYKANQGPKPGFPHTNDTPKDTIMNQHWTWQHYSVPADYTDATKLKTAHYRMYGESIWETLISDVELDSLWAALDYLGYKNERFAFTDLQGLDSVPAPLTKPTNNPDVEIIYMEGSEACIIIDDSGSMGSDNKMASAISGAKSYLDKLTLDNDYAAVIAFNSSASTIGALSLLDAAKKTQFKTAIDGLIAGGGTDFDAALSAGYSALTGSTRKGTYKYIVFLSDGEASVPYSVLTQLKDANIPVYAIGLGSGADMSALGAIASGTNGKSYFAATAASLNAIYSDISSVTTDDKLTSRIKENLNVDKNSVSTDVIVDATCKNVLFSSSFPTTDTMVTELTKPDGTKVNAGNVDTFDNITLTAESGYATYKVTDPAVGTWTIELVATGLTGDSEVIIEGKTDSDYSISTIVQGGTYPDPILVVATVSRNYPISGLSVSATVTAPDGSTSTLQMADDGVTPDAVADDGQYAGALSSYTDGDYQFDVLASNASGYAVETSKGISLKNGTSAVSTPISENFAAMEVANLSASGVAAYTPNTAVGAAVQLTVDGNKTSGIIANDEDISYYYFNMTAGVSYTIYTSGLFPDAMETLVTIYDSDTLTTALAEDSKSMNNSTAKIIHEADADGVIYVTVQHGSPGTGTFDIAIRETQATDSMDQPVEEAGTSSSSSDDGGGCFITTLDQK
jgi:calcium-activated chloride channel regulator 4